MATTPLTDFGFSSPPLPEAPALKLAELVRLQKFAQRITSTLDIEELVPRIVDEVAASLGCVEINLFLRDPEQSFYSDGITEAAIESGEEYGAERLLAQMQSPDVTLDGLLADVRKFANGTGLHDDATVILVRARGAESGSNA